MPLINVPTDLAEVVKKPSPKKVSRARAYLLKQEWGWEEVRDYVVYEIESRFGAMERDFKEVSIFKGFLKRWGADARRIAEYVFKIEDGYWYNKPVDIYRFQSGSDEHFASVIMSRLNASDQRRS